MDLNIDYQETVGAAYNANDGCGQAQPRTVQYLVISAFSGGIDLKWKHFQTARSHTTRPLEAHLHQDADEHVVGRDVESETGDAHFDRALIQEVRLFI